MGEITILATLVLLTPICVYFYFARNKKTVVRMAPRCFYCMRSDGKILHIERDYGVMEYTMIYELQYHYECLKKAIRSNQADEITLSLIRDAFRRGYKKGK